jgi:hypothetical protein
MERVLDAIEDAPLWFAAALSVLLFPVTTIMAAMAAYGFLAPYSVSIAIYAAVLVAIVGMAKVGGLGCSVYARSPSVKRWGFAIAIMGAAVTGLGATYHMAFIETAGNAVWLDQTLGWPQGTSSAIHAATGVAGVEMACILFPLLLLSVPRTRTR